MKKKLLYIFLTLLFLALTIFLIAQIVECHLTEMNTQIELFGFYKEDVIVLVANDIGKKWAIAGCVASVVAFIYFAICTFNEFFE